MTTLKGLVGIDSNLATFVGSTSLSSKQAVLIHQFDDGHGIIQLAAPIVPVRSDTEAIR